MYNERSREIYLVGGWAGAPANAYLDTIYVFDIDTETITDTWTMKHARSSMPAQIIDDDLYVFGGEHENVTPIANIDVCAIPRAITMDPTANPSVSPTGNPSKYPTLLPTDNPTNHPTLQPTKSPSHQTSGPTHNPTASHPTNTPTATPLTINPTVQPMPGPTLVVQISNPTKEPIMESTVSLKDIMISTPSTDKVRGNNAVDLDLPLWISLAIVCICLSLVACIIVCVQKAGKVRKHTELYIEA
eukprot:614877_1